MVGGSPEGKLRPGRTRHLVSVTFVVSVKGSFRFCVYREFVGTDNKTQRICHKRSKIKESVAQKRTCIKQYVCSRSTYFKLKFI